MDIMILMATNPMIIADLDIGNAEFGYLISVYTFGAGLCGFLGVFFLDLFDRKKVLIVLLLGFISAILFSFSTTTYLSFFIGRAISGAFNGAILALILSIISDLIPEARRATAIGFVFAAFGVASVAGIPASMWLAINYNWQLPYLAYAIFLLIATVLALIVMPKMESHLENRTERRNGFHALKIILSDGNLMRALLFTGLLVLGQFSIIPFIAGYMSSNVGYSNEDVTMMYFIGGIVTVTLSPLIGIWADRYGKERVFIVLTILSIVPLLLVTQMTVMSFWLSIAINSTFFILISGRMIPVTTITTSVVVPELRGSFMSMRTAVQQFSISLGSLFTGIITFTNEDGELVNYEYAGYMAVVLSIFAILVGRKLKIVE
ncbi:MAG: MFS transporter [Bacteroidetes bacterium]|nr:MFS transporter [Bacteroidota bacterium]